MATGGTPQRLKTPRGALWVFAGLLIILFALALAAVGSTEDSYDICRAGMECFGAGLFFGWLLAGPFVALTSIVGLVRASFDRRAGTRSPLRTAVLAAGWLELAVVVLPFLWLGDELH
ncbi:MAG: hypothetical protein ACXVY3_03325 [Gaiellaceae bacterium]